MITSIRRWLIFNSVGAIGLLVQLASLNFFVSCLGMGYMGATTLAVQTAVVHNFFWHQAWTWRDRRESGWLRACRRFVRFNLTNGLFSVIGNLIFMRLFLNALPVNYTIANVLAIAACSIVNYGLSDRLVFRADLNKKALSPLQLT
jgi:putative flippase GtrA